MNRGRLERLRDLLVADAKNPVGVTFDLGGWLGLYDRVSDSKNYDNIPSNRLSISCGTTACALGLACLNKEFQSEGLTFELKQVFGQLNLVPSFNEVLGFKAGAAFFDIEFDDAELLFDPMYYRNTKGSEAELEVARRVQQLLDGEKISYQ